MSRIWNLPKMSKRFRIFIDKVLENGYYKDPLFPDKSIYWEDKKKADAFDFFRVHSNREISDIPMPEIMNAAFYIVEQQISIPMEELIRLTLLLFGSRKGTSVSAVAEQAIQLLMEKG